MLDGQVLVDAHVHVARLPTLAADWLAWAQQFSVPLDELFDTAGVPLPGALARHFFEQGADHVLLFSEYSPKVTGIQPVEDVLPVIAADPSLFHLVGCLNPHLHYPALQELQRQVSHGAIAVKIHPVHGGFEARDRQLYPSYAWAQDRRLPVIVHCGTSTFAGSANAHADPALLEDVIRDFPELPVVLAHGGRGWWYDQAAFLALSRPSVWLEVSGLPPHRLGDYYGTRLTRLADKMIFGTDWPGVPGVRHNALALQKTLLAAGCTDAQVHAAWGGNAAHVFRLPAPG
jgi:uncharacterized protein